jgi:tetratricopeptide (TPR) repeat protein
MAAMESSPTALRIEGEVRRVQALLKERRFAEALGIAQALEAEVPENRDVLYLVAVSQRYLGRVADALRTLLRLEKLHPTFGRLFQERGHCYRAVGEREAAVAAYQQAVTLNGALVASWEALTQLLPAIERASEAEHARRQLSRLRDMPHPVVQASGMLTEGDPYGAERVLRGFLRTHGNHVEAMRLLAQVGVQLDVLDDAEFLLESVLVFAEHHVAARYEYALVLLQRHKFARALAEAHKLLRAEPTNRAFRTLLANSLVGLGEHEEALQVFRELSDETPENAEIHLSAGHALKTLGRQSEAIESYRAAASVRPQFGDAYWSLANLKTYRFTDSDIAKMQSLEADAGLTSVDRYHLCFAIGKALEDRDEYQESFRYYSKGNALKKQENRYDADLLERNLRRHLEVFTPEFFASRQSWGSDCADPIFIVGLPRAGSTLIEQILASHSLVEGTRELAEIPRMVLRLSGREPDRLQSRYPAVLRELSSKQVKRLGDSYVADTQVYRHGRPFFIDKMPNNFRHLGFIHLILPRAKIIDARREPLACCLSNFKQLFASGQEFTYSLEDIGRYYRSYLDLMRHWDTVLPGKILRVQYEELVDDLEIHVRRILEFCGLDFEPQCMEFHKTNRSVRTASSEQVRQPLFRQGLDQWRNFEVWLGPLKEALGLTCPGIFGPLDS